MLYVDAVEVEVTVILVGNIFLTVIGHSNVTPVPNDRRLRHFFRKFLFNLFLSGKKPMVETDLVIITVV